MEKLVAQFQPDRAILHGSYARKEADSKADVDVAFGFIDSSKDARMAQFIYDMTGASTIAFDIEGVTLHIIPIRLEWLTDESTAPEDHKKLLHAIAIEGIDFPLSSEQG